MSMVKLLTTHEGKKYLVHHRQACNLWACHGDVYRFKGLKSWHKPQVIVGQSKVESVVDVEKTVALLETLFRQTVDGMKERGGRLRRTRGGNYIIEKFPGG